MEKLKKLQQLLVNTGLKAIYLSSEVSRQYATGFHSSDGGVLITCDSGWFITDFRYIQAAQEHCHEYNVIMNTRENTVLMIIGKLLADHNITELAFEDTSVTMMQLEIIKSKIPVNLVPLGDRLEILRASKNDDEIGKIVNAQRVAEKAYENLLSIVEPGMTERRLHAELVYQLLLCGAEELSFEPIVLSGERTALPHGRASQRCIQKGEFVLLDFGVKINGYCSDMTRTFALGSVSEKMREIYEIVLRANYEGHKAARAGRHWLREIDAAARQVITEAGYGEYFGHGLGHGVGLEIHERLDGIPGSPGIAGEGAIATIEPGIYLPGEFGVRIEDMIVLTQESCINLTRTPKELLII